LQYLFKVITCSRILKYCNVIDVAVVLHLWGVEPGRKGNNRCLYAVQSCRL